MGGVAVVSRNVFGLWLPCKMDFLFGRDVVFGDDDNDGEFDKTHAYSSTSHPLNVRVPLDSFVFCVP